MSRYLRNCITFLLINLFAVSGIVLNILTLKVAWHLLLQGILETFPISNLFIFVRFNEYPRPPLTHPPLSFSDHVFLLRTFNEIATSLLEKIKGTRANWCECTVPVDPAVVVCGLPANRHASDRQQTAELGKRWKAARRA